LIAASRASYPSNAELQMPTADAAPLGAETGTTEGGDPSSPEIDFSVSAAVAPIALPPVVAPDSALVEQLVAPVSPNPSDPGTELSDTPRLALVPEPGIAMAAAASDGNMGSTEAT
jgi:hypothetical protein